jgi:putative tricarboxylic transport membrane protein
MAGSVAERPSVVSRRSAETATAATLAVLGGIVSAASLAHDIGWSATGPGAGYFPFRVGVLLAVAGVALVIPQLGARTDAVFATRDDLRRTLGVVGPTAALAGGTMALGSYVASGLFLTWMMRRHGGYGWLPAAACGAVSIAVFYLVFDLWFRVPLAKGPLEAALGL